MSAVLVRAAERQSLAWQLANCGNPGLQSFFSLTLLCIDYSDTVSQFSHHINSRSQPARCHRLNINL